MARLRLTESKDGVRRATMRVDFRVDADKLVRAGLWHLERHYGQLASRHVCERVISGLTRKTLLASARDMFSSFGYHLEDIGNDIAAGNHRALEARVAVLFPEFG